MPKPHRATRRPLLPALLLVTLGACSPAPTASGPGADTGLPRIGVQGNHFVDATGGTVVLRGVSFSDPDKLEREGHWNREYFAKAREWGSNVVRFPVHPSAWRRRGEAEYLRLLDEGVRLAEEQGMYVILDWHSIGNLVQERFQSPNYVTTPAETFDFWSTVARRYADRPSVAFYELFNEPTDGSGMGQLPWEEHRRLTEAMIDTVRAHAPDAVVLVGGLDWAYDLTPVRQSPIARPAVAYVSHPYPQKRPPPWEEKWERDWGFVAERYPVFATELGFVGAGERGAHVPTIGDERYGEAIVDFFERRGISWTAWVFDPNWAPMLFEDWSFEPTPQGRFFRAKLQELNGR